MIPKVVQMDVYPVAGHDSMELNLSGAHAPYFTRNVVVLTDSEGNLGVGEVPGGQKITKALEDVKDLVLGTSIADYKGTLNKVRAWLNTNIKDDVRGLQTFDLRTGVHVVTAIEAPLLDLFGKFLDLPAAALMGGRHSAGPGSLPELSVLYRRPEEDRSALHERGRFRLRMVPAAQ